MNLSKHAKREGTLQDEHPTQINANSARISNADFVLHTSLAQIKF